MNDSDTSKQSKKPLTRIKNYYWLLMYKLFKKRKPIPKELLDFDEIHTISDTVKKELENE